MLAEIVHHTPVAVWAGLAALVALGLSRLRPRSLSTVRLFALPALLGTLGLASLLLDFGSLLVVLVWAMAFALAAWAARRLPAPRGLAWDAAAARLLLPGSWLPLGVMLAMFVVRYASAVAAALHPEWRHTATLGLPLALASGAVSGLLLGRSLGLLHAARQNPAA